MLVIIWLHRIFDESFGFVEYLTNLLLLTFSPLWEKKIGVAGVGRIDFFFKFSNTRNSWCIYMMSLKCEEQEFFQSDQYEIVCGTANMVGGVDMFYFWCHSFSFPIDKNVIVDGTEC